MKLLQINLSKLLNKKDPLVFAKLIINISSPCNLLEFKYRSFTN